MTIVTRAPFGTLPDGRAVDAYDLADGRLAVRVLTYGARLAHVRVPDRAGTRTDVLLALPALADLVADDAYLGVTVGRYANRLAAGRFTLDGVAYQVPPNEGANALHGGRVGFDRALWEAAPDPAGVTFRHVSPDGDEGFPGALDVAVRFGLPGDGTLTLDYTATTDRPTVLNLTNHAYWNLGGAGPGTRDVLDHLLTVPAARYTPVDAALLPTGELAPVAGTPFDFRRPTPIGARIGGADAQLRIGRGYDHNFVLDGGADPAGLHLAARVAAPATGITMEIHTDQPGLQVYSGNVLRGDRPGLGGAHYATRGALVLETQHFPDSPNQPGFPATVLRPGDMFRSRTVYRFGTA